jgi:hypothetical protein
MFADSKLSRETMASGRGRPRAVRFTGLRIIQGDGLGRDVGRAEPVMAVFR